MSALNMMPMVSEQARALAARLSALFDADRTIVAHLNDAQHRLKEANDRLWAGLAPDAFGLIYQGAAAAGHSQIAQPVTTTIPAGRPGPASPVAVLAALPEIHWTIDRAFCDYQSANEQRRQLAVDVGELAARLTDALRATGWSEQDAHAADVHQLANASREPAR